MKVKQNVSEYLSEQHREKNGVPTMGGLIFIIPTILTIIVYKNGTFCNFLFNSKQKRRLKTSRRFGSYEVKILLLNQ